MRRPFLLLACVLLIPDGSRAQDLTRVSTLIARIDSSLARISAQSGTAPGVREPGTALALTGPAVKEQTPPAAAAAEAAVLPADAGRPESERTLALLVDDLRRAVEELKAKPAIPVFPSIKVGFLGQFHAQAAQEQTSALQDADAAHTRHWQRQLFIRRLRILVGGSITQNTSFFFESDAVNIGRVGTTGGKAGAVSMYVQDAQLQHTFAPAFSLIAGLHLVGISHNALQSAASLMALNYGTYQFVTSTPLDNSVGRDIGLTARGFLADDRLEYRLGLYSGRNVNLYSPLRSTLRLQYSFLDREKGFFYTGTTLGKGRMITVGGGLDVQASYRGFSFDTFIDLPVGESGAVTVSASTGFFDGGGSDLDSTAFTGLVPRQAIHFVEAGYLFRELNLQPYVKFEAQDVRATVLKQVGATPATLAYQNSLRSGNRWGVGVNYFLNGHGASVKFVYEVVTRNRPSRVAGIAEKATNGEATLQIQFFTF